ncbi:Lrp/AsnC family transcriptional regulator [Kocuria sp. JC486]|uniref:Lrp/AsnC family transcriptional regulator n=1 Tax=Kocuria soli TaxID=2485125 RepID=A0A3N3ZVP9_9MICC|nr:MULTISPECIES: Lrp/AsnC family transcriptional regulator [Kocuria]NHU84836.1 Lrp/AsnC family transcriptional regulator [Kocuria sp. JC486]ROZ64298.1 Lrp/AsnC family transcriptional regulator [Kocuria soli]
MALDGIDRAIIGELSRDGRASYQQLSQAVGLAPNTVADRMRRLRESGVITGSTVVIDERALGMELGVLSDIKLHDGVSRVEFAESLTKVPQVIGALRLTGEYDYQLHIVCSGASELESVIEVLKSEYDVASVNSRLILREVPVDKAKLLEVVP